jgi:S-adenosylmethionine hydrolase
MNRDGPPTIALLTDFGLRDNYVGVMKGVMFGICPEARFVDISHEISPGDIPSAAFLLERSVDYFPENTVFLVVVDPGVGSERRPIALRTGKMLCVGPDNGVFSRVLDRADLDRGPVQIVEITEPEYGLSRVSNTFHGRDIFAPAAAHLAGGVDIGDLGQPISDPIRIPRPVLRKTGSGIESEVVYVDRFGNLVTAIPESALLSLDGDTVTGVRLTVDGKQAGTLADSYASVPPGEPVCVVGGFGYLEISVNQGSAAEYFGAEAGVSVTVFTKTPKKNLPE